MKKVRQPVQLDYRLKISPHFNEQDRSRTTHFVLETVQSFASFVYEISVKERIDGNTIHWKILGLKPPRLSIPASGHARFEREYDALNGTFEVVIESIDGRTNVFTLRFAANAIQLVQAPREGFVELGLGSLSHERP